MASSTSSSKNNANSRMANRPWLKYFFQSLLIFCCLVGTWEGFWRYHGFWPKVKDGFELWAETRKQIQSNDPKAVVFIGASRVQQGIDVDAFREAQTSLSPYQLAISGCSPFAMIEYFANDSQFTGTLVVDVTPRLFFHERENDWPPIRDWISKVKTKQAQNDAYLEPFYKPTELKAKMFIQRYLIAAGWEVTPKRVIQNALSGTFPEPAHWWINERRTQRADYTMIDQQRFIQSRIQLSAHSDKLEPAQALERVQKYKPLVEKLQKRGAQVVFLRMPTTSGVRDIEKLRFPRQDYWDMLEREMGSVGAISIHFEDYAQLSGYDCPDACHLGKLESQQFSSELARILQEKTQR